MKNFSFHSTPFVKLNYVQEKNRWCKISIFFLFQELTYKLNHNLFKDFNIR